jgi:endonuclease/exonuclease/phosphatase family metal-dependent hydrolase
VRWIRPDDPEDRARLDAWCWAVGPVHSAAGESSSGQPVVDSLAVLVWNTHVGQGDVRKLVADLRSGRLTAGEPVQDFLLLLQEAHRDGVDVPRRAPEWAATTGRIGGRGIWRRADVTDLAWVEGLHLFYAPSMRNGEPGDGGPPEDRGNAILSTLPLTRLTAAELPYERQRRVAVFATVGARTSDGEPWQLRAVSAHLDNRAAFARIYRSFGAAQSNQARGLLAALEGDVATVVGGDLNTWYRKRQAGAVELLQARFASVRRPPGGSTADLPLLPDLRLDHLFFGVPDDWGAGYEVVDDRYGSDHNPLLGWVRMKALDPEVRIVDQD